MLEAWLPWFSNLLVKHIYKTFVPYALNPLLIEHVALNNEENLLKKHFCVLPNPEQNDL